MFATTMPVGPPCMLTCFRCSPKKRGKIEAILGLGFLIGLKLTKDNEQLLPSDPFDGPQMEVKGHWEEFLVPKSYFDYFGLIWVAGFFSVTQSGFNYSLGGGFKHFLFSPLPGEMIQFD